MLVFYLEIFNYKIETLTVKQLTSGSYCKYPTDNRDDQGNGNESENKNNWNKNL